MKKLFCIIPLLFLVLGGTTFAENISPAMARQYLGKRVTVTGRVVEFRTLSDEAFLDMGGRHPKELFTVFCPPEANISRAKLAKYEGKKISVKGKIEIFGNRPEIVLTSLDQISSGD